MTVLAMAMAMAMALERTCVLAVSSMPMEGSDGWVGVSE